jgi:hypothetical protein
MPGGTVRRGLVVFAAVLLALIGLLNLLDGLTAVFKASLYFAAGRFVIGDLRIWGWTAAILGILQILTAAGVLWGYIVARWAGVGLVAVNALAQMFLLPAYPAWSLIILAADLTALWALCAYGGDVPEGAA